MHQGGKCRVGAQIGQHSAHIDLGSGNGAVDAFTGQQNQAFDIALQAQVQQGCPTLRVVGQIDKQIKGSGQVAGIHLRVHGQHCTPTPS